MIKIFYLSRFFLFCSFLEKKEHVISFLLCLECIILFLIVILSYIINDIFIRIFIICIGACEAAVGLRVLVSLVRSSGNESLNYGNNLI